MNGEITLIGKILQDLDVDQDVKDFGLKVETGKVTLEEAKRQCSIEERRCTFFSVLTYNAAQIVYGYLSGWDIRRDLENFFHNTSLLVNYGHDQRLPIFFNV
jgi:hypothetical protein